MIAPFAIVLCCRLLFAFQKQPGSVVSYACPVYTQTYVRILMWMHLFLIVLRMMEEWNSLYLGQHLASIMCWILQQMKEFKDEIALLSQPCFLPPIPHLEYHMGMHTHCSRKQIIIIIQNNYHCSVTFLLQLLFCVWTFHHLILTEDVTEQLLL